MLNNFPLGSDLTLLNTIYHPAKRMENGKYGTDAITLIYKDNVSKKKFQETIESPEYEFYIAKDGCRVDYNRLFIDKSDVEVIKVKYQDVLKEIAFRTNNKEFYYDNIKSGNANANKMLHTLPDIFGSDIDIQDFYRFKFKILYGRNLFKPDMAYLDIEADTINMKGDFPEMGECPINALTIVDDKRNKVYTLLLRNPDNPLIAKLEENMGQWFIDKIRATMFASVRGEKRIKKYGLDKLEFEIHFYDDELDLLEDSFTIINMTKPDFVLAWNMAFDIPYIIARLQKLGAYPESVICHDDFKYKECYYFVDSRSEILAERGDYAKISSYSVYLDQMIHFASRRKGQSAIKNYKLSTIGDIFAKVSKLDYSHITHDIAKLPYLDYETFVIYNIVDTIVQKCIEEATGDMDFVFTKASANNTRYEKAHRNTIYLYNRGILEFYDDGLILGNNINKFKEKPEGKFPGALVGDPKNVEPDFFLQINGFPINIIDNIIDYDFKSLYPSIMIECNIAHHTQIGKLIIDQIIYSKENPYNDEKYDRGGKFMEDFNSQNILDFCHRWFNSGTYEDLMKDLVEFFTKHRVSSFRMVTDGMFNAISILDGVDSFDAIGFTNSNTTDAITFYKQRPNINTGGFNQ